MPDGIQLSIYITQSIIYCLSVILAYFLMYSKHGVMYLPINQRENKSMELAKVYILNHLEQPPTIAQIARHICQSESSLKRKFKSVYGISVYQFIQYSRIMKAKGLLDTKRYNVTQVAYEVGYSNISHFSKAFKKYISHSPGEYIKLAMQHF